TSEVRLLSWRALCNARLPVHRLPAEILLEVFKYFIPPVPMTPEHSISCPWVPLMSVCRRWCVLIRDTPRFWQDIPLKSNTKWVPLALYRARQAPLGFWIPFDAEFDKVVPLVREHACRT
ncbi:hypothetical protein C8Q79DRAFT_884789, partial [Trametes meyenii]